MVTVDPGRLDQLAKALRALSDVLHSDGQQIVSTFNAWQSALTGLGTIAVQGTYVDGAATAMRKRADVAADLLSRQPPPAFNLLPQGGLPLGGNPLFPPSPLNPLYAKPGLQTVMMAWDSDPAADANANIADLNAALKNPSSQASMDTFARVSQDLQDRQADPTYMQTFYANGGAALILSITKSFLDPSYNQAYTPGGIPSLNAAQQQITTAFANNLAAASMMKQIPQDNFHPLVDSTNETQADMTALALLMQAGPSGASWNPQTLAFLGDSATNFASGVQMGDSMNLIAASGDAVKGEMFKDLAPAQEVLVRVGENPAASIDLLSDSTNGASDASTLVWLSSNAPSRDMGSTFSLLGNQQAGAPQILSNITLQKSGNPPQFYGTTQQMTQAAMNVFTSVGTLPDPSDVTPFLSSALSNIAVQFVGPLSYSAHGGYNADSINARTGQLQLQPKTLTALMLAIGADQNAASNFNSAVGTATAYAVQHANDPGSNASNEVNYLGALEGFLTTAEQHGNIAAAQKLDGSNAAKNAWANLVFSVASATPIPGSSALEAAFQLTNSAGSSSIVQIWPTNKAAGAQSDAQLNMFAGKSALDVPIAQGLIDGDPKLKQAVESGNYAWYQNGKVVPDTSSMDDFVTWFDGQVQPFSQVAQNGYTGSSTTYFIP